MALRPDLELTDATRAAIRAICERVNGLPLAIELAAARVRLLSPTLILERLSSSLDLSSGSRDLPERQRTLRGAIDWSHELLAEPERRLFRRLAVFAGGWTAELAELVTNADGDLGLDVLEGLESLNDKSLVRIEAAGSTGAGQGGTARDEPRFDLHPLLREYALERLEASGERAVLEARHAAALAVLAEGAGSRVMGPAGAAAIRSLDHEQHNIRAAFEWARRANDRVLAARIVAPIWRWFQQRGRLREGRADLEWVLAEPPPDPAVHLAALSAEGGLAYWADDIDASGVAYRARLALAEAAGDALERAEAHYDLGFVHMVRSEPDELLRHEEQALELFESVGNRQGVLKSRQALGLAVFLTGDYGRALELETANLAAFRAAGAAYQVADSMTFHAGVYYRIGDLRTAWEFVVEGLRWFAENDNQSGIARALGMAAIVLLEHGDDEIGTRVAGATYQLAREKGVMIAPIKVLHLPDLATTASAKLGEARAAELLAEGATTPIGEIIEQVLAMPAPGG